MIRAHLPEQVEVGDIVRIPHFRGARNKQFWMYRIAVPVEKHERKSKYKCALADIHSLYERGKDGFVHTIDTISWCEILHTQFPREVPRKVAIKEEKSNDTER